MPFFVRPFLPEIKRFISDKNAEITHIGNCPHLRELFVELDYVVSLFPDFFDSDEPDDDTAGKRCNLTPFTVSL